MLRLRNWDSVQFSRSSTRSNNVQENAKYAHLNREKPAETFKILQALFYNLFVCIPRKSVCKVNQRAKLKLGYAWKTAHYITSALREGGDALFSPRFVTRGGRVRWGGGGFVWRARGRRGRTFSTRYLLWVWLHWHVISRMKQKASCSV